MKWINNGIKYQRGCHEGLIAKFDGDGHWFSLGAMATQQTMKSEFKRLGEFLGASQCEVKREFDDEGNDVERDVVYFRFNYNNELRIADKASQQYIPFKG